MFKNKSLTLFLCTMIFTSSFVFAQAAQVVTLPVGDGFYNDWETSVGVSHYSLVDDSSCNGDLDYVSANEIGERDSYLVSLVDVPDGSVITSVSITPCASRSNNASGSAEFNVFYRLNSVDSNGSGSYLVTGNVPKPLGSTSFSNISVTKTATTTLEIGAIFTSGKKRVRLSNLSSVVTYIPAPTVNLIDTSNLISYYNFDSNSNDLTSSNNDGLESSIVYSGGKINNSANFNGVDSVITVADSPSLQRPVDAITMSAWMKVNSYTYENYPLIMDRMNTYTSDGYRFYLSGNSGKVRFTIGTLNGRIELESVSTVTLGAWQNWTATYDGSVMKIYLNGVLDASLMTTGQIIYSSNTTLGMGARTTGTTQYLDGALDEVSLWSSALNEIDIANLYNQGEGLQYPFVQ